MIVLFIVISVNDNKQKSKIMTRERNNKDFVERPSKLFPYFVLLFNKGTQVILYNKYLSSLQKKKERNEKERMKI